VVVIYFGIRFILFIEFFLVVIQTVAVLNRKIQIGLISEMLQLLKLLVVKLKLLFHSSVKY